MRATQRSGYGDCAGAQLRVPTSLSDRGLSGNLASHLLWECKGGGPTPVLALSILRFRLNSVIKGFS